MRATAFIEKWIDNFYSEFSEDMLYNSCFRDFGDSIEEGKENFMLSIEEAKEMVKIEGLYFNWRYANNWNWVCNPLICLFFTKFTIWLEDYY